MAVPRQIQQVDFNKFTTEQIKQHLAQRNLPTTGDRAALLTRYKNIFEKKFLLTCFVAGLFFSFLKNWNNCSTIFVECFLPKSKGKKNVKIKNNPKERYFVAKTRLCCKQKLSRRYFFSKKWFCAFFAWKRALKIVWMNDNLTSPRTYRVNNTVDVLSKFIFSKIPLKQCLGSLSWEAENSYH